MFSQTSQKPVYTNHPNRHKMYSATSVRWHDWIIVVVLLLSRTLAVAALVTDSPAASLSSSSSFPLHDRCEPITVAICTNIPYNLTTMPNRLGHSRQEEAGLEAIQFTPLVKVNCSPDLQFFLCLVYVPLCTILDQPIPPCRSLCQSARRCEHVMRNFGLDWPASLECSQFPEAGGSEVCVSQNAIGSSGTTMDGVLDGASSSSSSSAPSSTVIRQATGPKVIIAVKNDATEVSSVHRNIRFVCPVQLKTPSPMGYSLSVAGEVSVVVPGVGDK